MKNYESLTDSELCKLAVEDHAAKEFLMRKYNPLIKKISHKLYLVGADTDDIVIEGMLGLNKAIDTFDDSKSSFITYTSTCIKNSILDAIKSANKKTIVPADKCVSILQPINSEEGSSLWVDIITNGESPETNAIHNEDYQNLLTLIRKTFSKEENEILDLFIDGYSYVEIAEKTNVKRKKVDNTIQKIRNKLQLLKNPNAK